ncbi:MAG TPA: phosphoribosyltransferase family protein [Devosiaceae bacterium]|nr:phosphoribosyltransferase family protein [Devosiaceae bacterium]
MNTRFPDRASAGRALADRLGPLDPAETVVLALPRGGVPVAYEIAARIGAPLDVVLVSKIGAPGQPELALGAVVDGDDPVVVVNCALARSLGFTAGEVRAMAADGLKQIERRRDLYRGGRAPPSVAGKTAIVVDDGIATGASARAAVQALRRRGARRVVLAVPVAPGGVLAGFSEDVDEVVCIAEPRPFVSVGSYYDDFGPVSDKTVVALLAAAARDAEKGRAGARRRPGRRRSRPG